MEKDVSRAIERSAGTPARDLDGAGTRRGVVGWPGTGLCAEAQADGVPCPGPRCSCERCARAVRARE